MDDRIAYSLLFTNGMVMTFDWDGEQMPDYQGQYGSVVHLLIAVGVQKMKLCQWMASRMPDGNPWVVLAEFEPLRVV